MSEDLLKRAVSAAGMLEGEGRGVVASLVRDLVREVRERRGPHPRGEDATTRELAGVLAGRHIIAATPNVNESSVTLHLTGSFVVTVCAQNAEMTSVVQPGFPPKLYRGRYLDERGREKASGTGQTTDTLRVEVVSDQGVYPLSPRNDLRNHSPSGLAHGYGGSGPAQLSLALLADYFGNAAWALALYQRFKEEWTARQSQAHHWDLDGPTIESAVRRFLRLRLSGEQETPLESHILDTLTALARAREEE